MTWKAGDKILYHGAREATLIKPMTPYGVKDSHGVEGQCWEIKFDNLPRSTYRWLYANLDLSVQGDAKQ